MKNWKYIEGAKTGNADLKSYSESKKTENGLARARKAMNKKNPDGLRLKIQDYAGQGLSYQDIVNQLIRFGYDKSDIEAQKEYIKKMIQESKE